jgi:hypothetical protein
MSHSKVLLVVAFVCELIAALSAAGIASIGPVLAWAFGGIAAWFLAQAV